MNADVPMTSSAAPTILDVGGLLLIEWPGGVRLASVVITPDALEQLVGQVNTARRERDALREGPSF